MQADIALKELNQKLELQTSELKSAVALMQSEKMSALGKMVAGVAHEINNPVNFIHGNLVHVGEYTQDLLQLLDAYQEQYPDPPQSLQAELDNVDLAFLRQDLKEIVQSMTTGSKRIRDIVLSLRNFSRLDESDCKFVNIHEGINNTLLLLKHRLKTKSASSKIKVIKEYGQLPMVECFPGELNQVFMHIIENAIDALEESAQRRSKDKLPLQSSRLWISTQVNAKDRVRIEIADNGLGIPEMVRSQIFDPFFTTKRIGKGTGLGLSVSYQVVTEKHNGTIRCDSTPGEGTKFVIEIPKRLRQSSSLPA